MEAAKAYLRDLRDELRDANRRLESADEEGAPVILSQIHEIERDIVRYSAILEDAHENGHHGTPQNHTDQRPATESRKKTEQYGLCVRHSPRGTIRREAGPWKRRRFTPS